MDTLRCQISICNTSADPNNRFHWTKPQAKMSCRINLPVVDGSGDQLIKN